MIQIQATRTLDNMVTHYCFIHKSTPAKYHFISQRDTFTYCQPCFDTIMKNLKKGRSVTVRVLT